MGLLDIIGPVMVGPSSSHTAGAARMGLVGRRLLGEPVRTARVLLHGSFAATGVGHGTDRAIVAGLMGMTPDDPRLPEALALAPSAGMAVSFATADLGRVHPNSARLTLHGERAQVTFQAASIGGGQIHLESVDGLEVGIAFGFPTLLTEHEDSPGRIAQVAGVLARSGVNVAFMRVLRAARGQRAIMIVECDDPITDVALAELGAQGGFRRVCYFPPAE